VQSILLPLGGGATHRRANGCLTHVPNLRVSGFSIVVRSLLYTALLLRNPHVLCPRQEAIRSREMKTTRPLHACGTRVCHSILCHSWSRFGETRARTLGAAEYYRLLLSCALDPDYAAAPAVAASPSTTARGLSTYMSSDRRPCVNLPHHAACSIYDSGWSKASHHCNGAATAAATPPATSSARKYWTRGGGHGFLALQGVHVARLRADPSA
jgi:hypothetical protein